jgi:predicted membrane chloride channel (bestrophin family)
MVVGSEEEITYAIFFRNNSAKAAHMYSLSDWGKFGLKSRNFARYVGIKFLIIAFQENYNQDINGV